MAVFIYLDDDVAIKKSCLFLQLRQDFGWLSLGNVKSLFFKRLSLMLKGIVYKRYVCQANVY